MRPSYSIWRESEKWQGADRSYLMTKHDEIAVHASGDHDAHMQSNTLSVIQEWKMKYRQYGHYKAVYSALEGLVGDDWKRRDYWHEHIDPLQQLHSCPSDVEVDFGALYSGSIGYEVSHLRHLSMRGWWYGEIENYHDEFREGRLKEATLLWDKAYAFEYYLHTAYVGQKRFSLEGLESLVPCLSAILEHFEALGYAYVGMGASHRGRLNVLANVLGMGWAGILDLFEGRMQSAPDGDVKYHVGYRGHHGTMDVELFPNPSHLESVNSVVMGSVRSMLDQHIKSAAIILHGDAAFTAQGVVSECFNMRKLKYYDLEGSIHIICNNHIGFTTSPSDARSSVYVTDIALGLDIPVLHVNSSDLASVLKAVDLAVKYKDKFKQDVIIDLQGMRVRGHNESDESKLTNPQMVSSVLKHMKKMTPEATSDVMLACLKSSNTIAEGALSLSQSRETLVYPDNHDQILSLWMKKWKVIQNMNLHPVVREAYITRCDMFTGDRPMLWSGAENYAFLRILSSGGQIRLMGQDVQRGTFTQRLAVVLDQDGGKSELSYDLCGFKDKITIGNSPLSEYATLGYEFGYALKQRSGLVVWEAQFGDFFNGAQIIIDQFLVACHNRWGLDNHLVLLLPHGYEGQGAEHSSARIERFLQLATGNNLNIVIPSTPSQYHHALLQASNAQRPWIIFTPKSLLRHEKCMSTLPELMDESWKDVITRGSIAKARKIIITSGRMIYDVLDDERMDENTAIICIERLHPLPAAEIKRCLKEALNKKDVVYCQDEPENQGAYRSVCEILRELCSDIRFVCRLPSAVSATGYASRHHSQRESGLKRVFGEGYE